MEPGERFSFGAGPDPLVFTLVVHIAKDERGRDKVLLKARDAAGIDHSLTEIYIGNNQSYAVDPVGSLPARDADAEGGGV
jgi:hypothetical protein